MIYFMLFLIIFGRKRGPRSDNFENCVWLLGMDHCPETDREITTKPLEPSENGQYDILARAT